MKALEKQDPNDEQQDGDDEKIKFATGLARNRFAKIDIFGALQSFWRQFKRPRDHEGNGEAYHNQHDHEPDCPIWNLEEREDLRRYLHQQPCDDRVGDRNLVNVAPLQLSEEVLWIHSARLDEALVTAALYLDGRDLKSAWQRPKHRTRYPLHRKRASQHDLNGFKLCVA